MIAPIRERDRQTPEETSRFREMRRLVASLFLAEAGELKREAAPIAAWKAWCFLAWAAAIAGIYLLTMIGAL